MAQICCCIHVAESFGEHDAPSGQGRDRIRQGVLARPAHPVKEAMWQAGWVPCAHQPIAAISGRAESHVMRPQRGKGVGYMGAVDAGDICADQADRSKGCSALKHPFHALPEVSAPLWQARQICGKHPGSDGLIGGNSQNDLPTRIAQASDEPGGLMAKPPGCGDGAYALCQSCLDPSGARLFDHDDEGGAWPHNSSTMSR